VFVVFNGYVLLGVAKTFFRRGGGRGPEAEPVPAGFFRDVDGT